MEELTHINGRGRAKMVDVSDKPETFRTAVAGGTIRMSPVTAERIRMCKAIQKDMEISNIHLCRKTGGRSGDYEKEW